MKANIYVKAAATVFLAVAMGNLSTGCSEKIDESNLYTAKTDMIADYLAKQGDKYSSFSYILQRADMDKVLSAYGTYTCFAPDNDAVEQYIDSLYDDTSNKDLPHNGMTARSLEGLTDSLCSDIALFHLTASEYHGIDMQDGMTIQTMLGRDINTSIDPATGQTSINVSSLITNMDIELGNGILHEVSRVISRSNRMVSGELAQHGEFSIFTQALNLTGLADSVTTQYKAGWEEGQTNKYGFYIPEKVLEGYTLFAETDATLAAKGINSLDDLVSYANNVYAHCADQGSGWYDYYRNHNVAVSTGSDYKSASNALNMFVRYHIIKTRASYDNLVYSGLNEVDKVQVFEYYETMLPMTLMKVTKVSGQLLINRYVSNPTLTDQVAEQGSESFHAVVDEGVGIGTDNIQALNGYIHPINDMLAYTYNVPKGVLNERMRFDCTSLIPEIQSNSLKVIRASVLRALNGGKTGSDTEGKALGGDFVAIVEGFSDNLVIYNGESTRLYYLPGMSNSWCNYQKDEFNSKGAFDFAFRLPPVPDGTYEIRIGYTANQYRGMLQFYLGTSSALTSMRTIDIPLDMRHMTSVTGLEVDALTGWCDYNYTDDYGVESDVNMRNLGYMRAPLYYCGETDPARGQSNALRRILSTEELKQGEYWLRFKTVLPDDKSTQFHLDYLELVPQNVYNNALYGEDMY